MTPAEPDKLCLWIIPQTRVLRNHNCWHFYWKSSSCLLVILINGKGNLLMLQEEGEISW
jgi:hypothetical protein